jgi:hypothetical protein
MVSKNKIKESDIAQICVSYLESNNYTVYKEVTVNGKGGRRADIYGVDNYDKTIVVEAKLSFSLKVLEQAYSWRLNSNEIYICIPKPKRNARKSFAFSKKVCETMGIGIILVDYFNNTCHIELESKVFDNNVKMPKLYESQKYSVAGNDESKYHTAFKETCMNIDKYMADISEPVKLSDIMKNIQHHYKTNVSGTAAIKKMIEYKVITNYMLGEKGYITKLK